MIPRQITSIAGGLAQELRAGQTGWVAGLACLEGTPEVGEVQCVGSTHAAAIRESPVQVGLAASAEVVRRTRTAVTGAQDLLADQDPHIPVVGVAETGRTAGLEGPE